MLSSDDLSGMRSDGCGVFHQYSILMNGVRVKSGEKQYFRDKH